MQQKNGNLVIFIFIIYLKIQISHQNINEQENKDLQKNLILNLQTLSKSELKKYNDIAKEVNSFNGLFKSLKIEYQQLYSEYTKLIAIFNDLNKIKQQNIAQHRKNISLLKKKLQNQVLKLQDEMKNGSKNKLSMQVQTEKKKQINIIYRKKTRLKILRILIKRIMSHSQIFSIQKEFQINVSKIKKINFTQKSKLYMIIWLKQRNPAILIPYYILQYVFLRYYSQKNKYKNDQKFLIGVNLLTLFYQTSYLSYFFSKYNGNVSLIEHYWVQDKQNIQKRFKSQFLTSSFFTEDDKSIFQQNKTEMTQTLQKQQKIIKSLMINVKNIENKSQNKIQNQQQSFENQNSVEQPTQVKNQDDINQKEKKQTIQNSIEKKADETQTQSIEGANNLTEGQQNLNDQQQDKKISNNDAQNSNLDQNINNQDKAIQNKQVIDELKNIIDTDSQENQSPSYDPKGNTDNQSIDKEFIDDGQSKQTESQQFIDLQKDKQIQNSTQLDIIQSKENEQQNDSKNKYDNQNQIQQQKIEENDKKLEEKNKQEKPNNNQEQNSIFGENQKFEGQDQYQQQEKTYQENKQETNNEIQKLLEKVENFDFNKDFEDESAQIQNKEKRKSLKQIEEELQDSINNREIKKREEQEDKKYDNMKYIDFKNNWATSKNQFHYNLSLQNTSIQSVNIDEETFDEIIKTNQELLFTFILQNLKFNQQNLSDTTNKKYQKELQKIKQNIQIYFDKKRQSFEKIGQYAFWLESYLQKIQDLGFFDNYSFKECNFFKNNQFTLD